MKSILSFLLSGGLELLGAAFFAVSLVGIFAGESEPSQERLVVATVGAILFALTAAAANWRLARGGVR